MIEKTLTDLLMSDDELSMTTAQMYACYALEDLEKWRLLLGKYVQHRDRGKSRVTAVEDVATAASWRRTEERVPWVMNRDEPPHVLIQVRHEGAHRAYSALEFAFQFTDLELPAGMAREALAEPFMQRRLAKERAERERRAKLATERLRNEQQQAEERQRHEEEDRQRQVVAAARRKRVEELIFSIGRIATDPESTETLELLTTEFATLIRDYSLDEQATYVSRLPSRVLVHPALREFLNKLKAAAPIALPGFEAMLKRILELSDSELAAADAVGDVADVFAALLLRTPDTACFAYLANAPRSILQDPALLPVYERVKASIADTYRAADLIRQMPVTLQEHPLVWSGVAELPPAVQVEAFWQALENPTRVGLWSRLSPDVRVLCVHRAVSQDTTLRALDQAIAAIESEPPIVQASLVLFQAKGQPAERQRAFVAADTILRDWVVNIAYTDTAPIEMSTLLPSCRMGVVPYCEGVPWHDRDEGSLVHSSQDPEREESQGQTLSGEQRASRAWCPRSGAACALYEPGGTQRSTFGLSGARVYPETELGWQDWSMLELLMARGIVPEVPDLPKPDEYVPKFAGWVNRANEIRARLRCSMTGCGALLVPDRAYARNRARYAVTVFNCYEGQGHDTGVYMNHCWACYRLIDNRESRRKDGRLYICIHCGSGTQHSESFAQGDLCPKCGISSMEDIANRRCRCRSGTCGHTITLPISRHLTGRRTESRRARWAPEVEDFEID